MKEDGGTQKGPHSMALEPDLKKRESWDIAMDLGAFSGRAERRGENGR